MQLTINDVLVRREAEASQQLTLKVCRCRFRMWNCTTWLYDHAIWRFVWYGIYVFGECWLSSVETVARTPKYSWSDFRRMEVGYALLYSLSQLA
jgi:hypothetical protein